MQQHRQHLTQQLPFINELSPYPVDPNNCNNFIIPISKLANVNDPICALFINEKPRQHPVLGWP